MTILLTLHLLRVQKPRSNKTYLFHNTVNNVLAK